MPNAATSLRKVRLALVILFGTCCLVGGSFIFFYWKGTSLSIALEYCGLFIVIMAVIHSTGYLLWWHQIGANETVRLPKQPWGEGISSAIKVGLIVQIVIFILTALVLDGSEMNKLCMMTIIGYWIGVGSILARRRASPTKLDLFFIRYVMFGLFVLSPFIARLVYGIIGESPLSGWQRWFGKP